MNVFLSIEDCKLNTTGSVFITVLLNAPNWGDECPVVRTNIVTINPPTLSPDVSFPSPSLNEDDSSTPATVPISIEIDREDGTKTEPPVTPTMTSAGKPPVAMSPIIEGVKKAHKRRSKSKEKRGSRSQSSSGQDDGGENNGDGNDGAAAKKPKGHREHRYLSRNKSSRSLVSGSSSSSTSSSLSRQQQQQQQSPLIEAAAAATPSTTVVTETSPKQQTNPGSSSSSTETLPSAETGHKQSAQSQHHKKGHRSRSSARKEDSSSGSGSGGRGTSGSGDAREDSECQKEQQQHLQQQQQQQQQQQFVDAMFLLGDEECDSSGFYPVKFGTHSWNFMFPTVAEGLQAGLYSGAQLVFSTNCALPKRPGRKSSKKGTIRSFGSFCLALENPVFLKALAAGETFVAYAEITSATSARVEVVGTFVLRFWTAPDQFDVESPDFAGTQAHDFRSSPLVLSQAPKFANGSSPQCHYHGSSNLQAEYDSSTSCSPIAGARVCGPPVVEQQQQDSQLQIPVLSLSSARGSVTNISLPPLFSKSSPAAPRQKSQRTNIYYKPSKLSQVVHGNNDGSDGKDHISNGTRSCDVCSPRDGISVSSSPSSQKSGEAGIASADVLSTTAECEGDEGNSAGKRTPRAVIDATAAPVEQERTPKRKGVEFGINVEKGASSTEFSDAIEFCGTVSSLAAQQQQTAAATAAAVAKLATPLVSPADGAKRAKDKKKSKRAKKEKKVRSAEPTVFYVYIHAAVNLPLVQGQLPSPFASLKTELEALAKQKAKSTTAVEEAVRTAVWRDVMSATLPATAATRGDEGLFLAIVDFTSKRFIGKITIVPRDIGPGECCHTGIVLNDDGAYALVTLYRRPLQLLAPYPPVFSAPSSPEPQLSYYSSSTTISDQSNSSDSTASPQILSSSSQLLSSPQTSSSSPSQECVVWVLPLEVVRRGAHVAEAAYFAAGQIVSDMEAYEQETPVPKFPFVTDYVREVCHKMKVVPSRVFVSAISECGVSPKWPPNGFPMRLIGDASCPPLASPSCSPSLAGSSAASPALVANHPLSPSPPSDSQSPGSSSLESQKPQKEHSAHHHHNHHHHHHSHHHHHHSPHSRQPGIVFEIYRFDGLANKAAFHDAKLCNYAGRSTITFATLAKNCDGSREVPGGAAHVRGVFTLPIVRQGASTGAYFSFSVSTESPQQCMAGGYFGTSRSSAEVNISVPIATSSSVLSSDLYSQDNINNENDKVDGNGDENAVSSDNGSKRKKMIPLFSGNKAMPAAKSQKNVHTPPPPPQQLGVQENQQLSQPDKSDEPDEFTEDLEGLKREVDDLKSTNIQLVVDETSSVTQVMDNASKVNDNNDKLNINKKGEGGGNNVIINNGKNDDDNNNSDKSHISGDLTNLTREQLVERVTELSESLRTATSTKDQAAHNNNISKKKLLRLEECERKYIKLSQSYREQGLFLKVLQEENGRLALANRECRLQQRIIEKLLSLVPEGALPPPYAMTKDIHALADYFGLDDDDNDNNEFFNDNDNNNDDDDNNNDNDNECEGNK